MIAYLFLGLLVLVAVISFLRMYVSANPVTLARVLKWVAIGLGGIATVLLILTGRLGLVLVVAGGLLPMFLRWRSMRDRMQTASGPSTGRTSRVDTAYFSMTLDHDTGALDGTVQMGRYKGRRLDELPLGSLLDLLSECRAADPESATVLEAYLDRVRGSDWRREEAAREAAGDGGAGGGRAGKAGMTRDEAYEILGLSPGASAEEIKEAHRRLMLRNHPDHGGSTYLAAKINMAKDLLLGN